MSNQVDDFFERFVPSTSLREQIEQAIGDALLPSLERGYLEASIADAIEPFIEEAVVAERERITQAIAALPNYGGYVNRYAMLAAVRGVARATREEPDAR
jgi:hypothetical protein